MRLEQVQPGLLVAWFGVGFVLLILVHEMGHFVAAKLQGLDVTLPTFIPFVGAYVLIRNQKRDPLVAVPEQGSTLLSPVDEFRFGLTGDDWRVGACRESAVRACPVAFRCEAR